MLSEKRKGRITGSNVGAILGVDPHRARDDVMRAMVREYHGAEKEIDEFAENVIFAYGKHHESGAIAQFQMTTGKIVEPCGFYVHPEYDWLGATPDGLVANGVGVFECKCPWSKRNDNNPVFSPAEELPHYHAQMQIEMACSGAEFACFYQWAPKGDAVETVVKNDKWFSDNIKALEVFYHEYLKERELPQAQKHLEPKRAEINTLEAARLAEEYNDLCDAIDRATERKKEVLSEIVSLAKEKNSIVCGMSLTKVERQGSISYANVVKEHCKGIDLEKYRGKPTEYWTLK